MASMEQNIILPISDSDQILLDNLNSIEVDNGMLEDRFKEPRSVEISLTTPVIHIDSLPDQIVLDECRGNMSSLELENHTESISIANEGDLIDFITNSVIEKSNADNMLTANDDSIANIQNHISLPSSNDIENNNKENIEPYVNQKDETLQTSKSFAIAFTLPNKYLLKKKRDKLENNGKQKLPSVGTSEQWLNIQLEKEEKLKIKEEKALKKRELQAEKEKLAEEKKKIKEKMKEHNLLRKLQEEKKQLVEENKKFEEKMKEIQKRIKSEAT